MVCNVAFTVEGLRLAGLSDDEIHAFPEEFVQGMEGRAGILGDVQVNHPRRWRLPARNWDLGAGAPDPGEDDSIERVALSAAHLVVQVRLRAHGSDKDKAPAPRDRLMAVLEHLVAAHDGVQALSLQWMERRRNGGGTTVEHFGFLDGLSEPVFSKAEAGEIFFPNHVHVGEVLNGYANAADHAPAKGEDGTVRALLHNGSFLVVRKLRQDAGLFEKIVGEEVKAAVGRTRDTMRAEAEAAGARPPTEAEILARTPGGDDIKAKMMGRWPSGHLNEGKPLVRVLGANPNDFDYDNDDEGRACPFHAHIRRANPRVRVRHTMRPFLLHGSRPPRLFRRGMSYGPPPVIDPGVPSAAYESLAKERGLVFMAYNASIGEQFETIQRWMSGGNSSGSYSGQSDPFLGVAEPGRKRHFRFEMGGETRRMGLDGSDNLHAQPRPMVRLEWGTYLFAPSISNLAKLKARAATARPNVSWSAGRGERAIERLRRIEATEGETSALLAWKGALEDPEAAADFTSASIWAAIRERHGDVLRTPYGVFVASSELVEKVLRDERGYYTANGYLARMRRSFGAIYLGQDAGEEDRVYERESKECNEAIMALDPDAVYATARLTTCEAIEDLVNDAIGYAQIDEEPRWEVTFAATEIIDELLAKLCEEWFGLSTDGNHFRRDGYRWDWKAGEPPYYPGHFLAPSRYFFQAHPAPEVETIGAAHGRSLREAMGAFLQAYGNTLTAPVARAVLDSALGKNDPAFAERTLVGAIMGFVPTLDGMLRRLLNEWLEDATFWALRARFAGSPADTYADGVKRLFGAIVPAMQLRAVPELIWRTATVSHTIAGADGNAVQVRPNDIVVVAQVSSLYQRLVEGDRSLFHAFGGDRTDACAPTHACPGYGAAIASIVGFLGALVESAHPLRAGPGPLTLHVEGPTAPCAGPAVESDEYAITSTPSVLAAKAAAIGDSWLDMAPFHRSLARSLKAMGYVPALGSDYATLGRTLKKMARDAELRDAVDDLRRKSHDVVLLGGGGNDLVHPNSQPKMSPLYKMLNDSPAPGHELIATEVDKFVDAQLKGHYHTILDALVKATSKPIVIHVYDHPIPDGRALGTSWLKKKFDLRHINEDRARAVMKVLIDRLNAMVATVAAAYEKTHPGRVHHVNLAGKLADAYGAPGNYKKLWKDELHPNKAGFDLLAEEIVKKLADLGV